MKFVLDGHKPLTLVEFGRGNEWPRIRRSRPRGLVSVTELSAPLPDLYCEPVHRRLAVD